MGNTVSRPVSIHQAHELLLKLEEAGLGALGIQEVIESPGNALAKNLMNIIKAEPYRDTPSQAKAREIMGKNFFGKMELTKVFKLPIERGYYRNCDNVPFSEETLECYKDTHILFLGDYLAIRRMREISPSLWRHSKTRWSKDDLFINTECLDMKWYLVRKGVVPKSEQRTYEQQLSMLSEEEYIPRACVLAFMITLMVEINNEYLFVTSPVRCADRVIDGDRTCLHVDSELGIFFSKAEDDAFFKVGISSALECVYRVG